MQLKKNKDDFEDRETNKYFTGTVTQKNHPPKMSKSGHGMTYVDDYLNSSHA